MNVMRFVGRNSREAMRKLREALGPDALVLANRPCAEGIELLAAAPGAIGALDAAFERQPVTPARAEPRGTERPTSSRPVAAGAGALPPGMSTVSFQDYVRQRLRERHRGASDEGASVASGATTSAAPSSAPSGETRPRSIAAARAAAAIEVDRAADRGPIPALPAQAAAWAAEPSWPGRAAPSAPSTPSAGIERVGAAASPRAPASSNGPVPAAPPRVNTAPRPQAPAPAFEGFAPADGEPLSAPGVDGFVAAREAAHTGASTRPTAARPAAPTGPTNDALVAELQSLKTMISRQFATMSWFEGVRRSPVQGKLLRTMVAAGFSLKLARSVVQKLPSDFGERDAQLWLEDVLARNLRCATAAEGFTAGGVFALIGPTGVGKTTTTAKIAARHVLRHGAQSVALITVDTYRLGAHDQLRAFGRILGVPVHIAHDAGALHDLLRMRSNRQLVLVDTVGMGHRDERIGSLLMSLPRTEINHVVVASCAAQAETIDQSLRAYEARQAAGVILTKVDEAARLGGALDCIVRQRLKLLGVCDGQRVPEDWHAAEPARLVRRALLAPPLGAFALDDEELPLVFGVAATLQGEGAHA
jgi:flagellar biosynthesis protein FlhF